MRCRIIAKQEKQFEPCVGQINRRIADHRIFPVNQCADSLINEQHISGPKVSMQQDRRVAGGRGAAGHDPAKRFSIGVFDRLMAASLILAGAPIFAMALMPAYYPNLGFLLLAGLGTGAAGSAVSTRVILGTPAEFRGDAWRAPSTRW